MMAHQSEEAHAAGTPMTRLQRMVQPRPAIARLFGQTSHAPDASKIGHLSSMTYAPANANVQALQRQYGVNWKKHLATQQGLSEDKITELPTAMNKTSALIHKLAGAPVSDSLGDRMVADLIKGAQANPRTGNVQIYKEQAETKLASAGVGPLDIAHMAGTLKALEASGFSKKEAAEYLNIGEGAIDAVLTVIGD